ncbi:MAG: glycosyltransferase [Nanoarchaeota archaeon]
MKKTNEEMENKKKEKVIIATSTLYRADNETDKIRAKLALEMIKKAKKEGYEIIVVDAGSPKKIRNEFEKAGAIVIPDRSETMGASRREAFREAFNRGAEIIIWMEPEKHDYIRNIEKSIKPIMENKAEMVIPNRKSFNSYPKAQQYIEPFANLFWKELTKADLDMWFGVRIFKRSLAHYFLEYRGEYGDKWDSLFIPIINALADGRKIESVKIDYVHDNRQTKNEEHSLDFYKKRIDQLNLLMITCENHWQRVFSKVKNPIASYGASDEIN